jgi:hypothetical protein
MKLNKPGYLIMSMLLLSVYSIGQTLKLDFENQVSSYATVNLSNPVKYQFGGRYIPTLSIADSTKNNYKFDSEISLSAYGNVFFIDNKFEEADGEIKPYRFWVRYSTGRFELRLGLQKINFGSATVFRPLMWFDKIDVRDPLQLTDGVYGILGRYYFKNNTNIWLWSLYGNDEPMGWETVPSRWQVPEFGGRIQQPVPKGEIALSYHHREADYSAGYDTIPSASQDHFPENKIGFDGKFDLGPGIWFEYVIKRNDPGNMLVTKWETYFDLGIDYTFAVGNGLTLSSEYFRYNNADVFGNALLKNTFTSLSASYPFGLMNSITAIVYYNFEPGEWSHFISFQRKYDLWSFYLMAFWNPDSYKVYSMTNDRNLYGGVGIQAMAVVNF